MDDQLSTKSDTHTPPSDILGEPGEEDDSIETVIECDGWNTLSATLIADITQAAHLARSVTATNDQAIVILLTNDNAVHALNKTWRGKDSPTNVLSFPTDETDPTYTQSLGDIALAHETIVQEAQEQNKPPHHHVLHLVVHGVLHLQGFDHMTDAEALGMETLERLILAKLDVPDPYSETYKGE